MNILFVNNTAGYFGGVEQYIDLAAKALRGRGHQVSLAYGNEGRDTKAYLETFAARYRCKEMMAKGGNGRPIDGILEYRNPDVVFVHKAPDAVLLSEKLRRFPTAVMVHDHDYCCPRRHKYHALTGKVCNRPAGFRCYLDCAFVRRDPAAGLGIGFQSIRRKMAVMKRLWELGCMVVGSRYMQEELEMNGCPADRIALVPPAFTRPFPDPVPLPQEPNILYVGQLIRGKGVDQLLRALGLLETDFRCRIVGDGNHRGKLETLCRKLGLEDRISFEGWVAPHQVHEMYAWARVSVVPSRWPEPFGMVGLEAMHHARPVVGFDVGGISDWLVNGSTGLCVPAGNVAAFAEAVKKVLADFSLAESMSSEGYSHVKNEYVFDKLIGQLEGVLSGVSRTRNKKAGALCR